MNCFWCEAEREDDARFCVICGSPFLPGGEDAQLAELAHVRYLLRELDTWDGGVVAPNARRSLRSRYGRRESELKQALDRRRGKVPPAAAQGPGVAGAPVAAVSAGAGP